jgi:hypothetical protein
MWPPLTPRVKSLIPNVIYCIVFNPTLFMYHQIRLEPSASSEQIECRTFYDGLFQEPLIIACTACCSASHSLLRGYMVPCPDSPCI